MMLIIVVEIMVSFTKVLIRDCGRSSPHSTALILLNSKMNILFEKNPPTPFTNDFDMNKLF